MTVNYHTNDIKRKGWTQKNDNKVCHFIELTAVHQKILLHTSVPSEQMYWWNKLVRHKRETPAHHQTL